MVFGGWRCRSQERLECRTPGRVGTLLRFDGEGYLWVSRVCVHYVSTCVSTCGPLLCRSSCDARWHGPNAVGFWRAAAAERGNISGRELSYHRGSTEGKDRNTRRAALCGFRLCQTSRQDRWQVAVGGSSQSYSSSGSHILDWERSWC